MTEEELNQIIRDIEYIRRSIVDINNDIDKIHKKFACIHSDMDNNSDKIKTIMNIVKELHPFDVPWKKS